MPAARTPLFCRDTNAARLLDMPVRDFRRLVECGSLPGPVRIADMERWDMEEVVEVLRGKKPDVSGGLDL